MKRLTSNKNVSEMNMCELAYNSCYAKDRNARYRDYDTDIDARELAIKLLEKYADIPNEFTCDEDFDYFIADALQYGEDDILGLIAVFYRNLWAMADLRERLKEYEDLVEQGKLPKLPCAVGDTVYTNHSVQGWYFRRKDMPYKAEVVYIGISNGVNNYINVDFGNGHMLQFKFSDIGKTVFLTKSKAEEALQKMNEMEVKE